MFTSCCPGWIKFAEHNFPDLLPNLSTCKSPQQMMGAMIKTYLAEKEGIKPEDIFVVSVMPCTAKKYEAERPEMSRDGVQDVDVVLTNREFARLLDHFGINFELLPEEEFDPLLGTTSGSGDIFAASGGVMESALRTAYNLVTGKDLKKLEFQEVRGIEGVKEATVDLGGTKLKVAVVNTLGYARKLAEKIQRGRGRLPLRGGHGLPGGLRRGRRADLWPGQGAHPAAHPVALPAGPHPPHPPVLQEPPHPGPLQGVPGKAGLAPRPRAAAHPLRAAREAVA